MKRRGIVFGILAAIAALWSAPISSADEPPAAAERVLRFPEDRSVGVVFARPSREGSLTFTAHDEDWKKVGDARGEVMIPAGSDVRFDVSYDASNDLGFLATLQPDDVQILNLEDSNLDDAGLKHVGRLTGLRVLFLNETRITDAGARHLSGLKQLEEIRLGAFGVHRDGYGVGNGAMAVLAELPELEFAYLRLTKVTDDGLKSIEGHPSLQRLSLAGTQVTNEGMQYLKTLPKLEHLRLGVYDEGAKITDEGLRVIGEMTGLKSLDLSGTKITDVGLAHLKNLKSLEKLTLDETEVTEAGFVHLEPLTSLESLRYYASIVTDKGAAHLAKVKSLRTLTVDFDISEKGIESLASLPHLESLDLTGEDVTDESLRHVAKMTSLKQVGVQNCPVTDAGLAHLASLRNLEWLSISDTRISGEGFAALKELPKLRTMNLTFGDRNGAYHPEKRPTLRYVGELSELTFLQLWARELSGDDLKDLTPLLQLEELHLEDTPVDDRGAFHLGGMTSLKSLSLRESVVTDAGLAHLANLPNLKYLSLTGHFTDAGLTHLHRMKSLREANFTSPYLTDDGIRSLAAAMPSLGSVERYDYDGNVPEVSYREGDTFRREGLPDERSELDALERMPPPEWNLTDWINADGDERTPESLHGKVVLIDFWGTWCGPCRAAMPKLKSLREKYGDQGLVIIGIHTTSGAEKMADYVAEEEIPWPVAADVENRTTDAWHVDSYPGYYLIDRDGRLRVADLYNDDIERAVSLLLAEEADTSSQ